MKDKRDKDNDLSEIIMNARMNIRKNIVDIKQCIINQTSEAEERYLKALEIENIDQAICCIMDFLKDGNIKNVALSINFLLNLYLIKEKKTVNNKSDTEQTEFKKNFKKPPIGVIPAFICAEERIRDLAGAISRASKSADYTSEITMWAREIIMQCNIIDSLRENA